MEENKLLFKPNWELVEAFARNIYKNDMAVLTKSDIKEIEKAIEDGAPFYNDKHGEMNFEWGDIVSLITIGFMAIQTVIVYVSWKYPRKPDTKVSNCFEPITDPENKIPDYVAMMLEDTRYGKDLKKEIIEELQKNKKLLNVLLYNLLTSNLSETTK